jgi:ribonucleoside-diphosphate reductase alpha chain
MAKTNYGEELGWELDVDFPSWANTEIYVKTISKGYLLPGEKPKDAYWRVATRVAQRLNKPQMATKFFDYIWKGWLNLATPVLSNTGTDRGLPISCFGIDVADSIYDIGNKNLELMLLAKHGGGVGIGINQIRPAGAPLQVMEHLMVLYHLLKFMILQYLQLTKVQYEEEQHLLTLILTTKILKNG